MRWKRISPLAAVATVSVMALTVQAAGVGSAAADSTANKTGGSGSSVAEVLSLKVQALGLPAHSLSAVTTTLGATTLANPFSAVINVKPLVADGTAIGEQTITAQNTSTTKSVGGLTKSVAGGVAALRSPGVTVKAAADAKQAAATLTSQGVGGLGLLGLNLNAFSANLNFGSTVANGVSDASKTVDIKNLALPSILDLLDALGLPVGSTLSIT